MNCKVLSALLMILPIGMIGCGKELPTESKNQEVIIDGKNYLLDTEPKEIKDVIAVRKVAKDGDAVVVVGRIGGSENPWIKNRAAFTIVDNSLKACSDIPGDECPIPWDYCCELDKLPTSTAFIKIVDETGAVVKTDTRKLLPVQELSTVVVLGKAKRDDAGNLTVLANKIYVKKK